MKYLFGKRFKQLLDETDYTYDQLKVKLGIKSKGTITKYYNGSVKNVHLDMICKIADVFEVSPIWLIGWTDDRHYVIKNNKEK